MSLFFPDLSSTLEMDQGIASHLVRIRNGMQSMKGFRMKTPFAVLLATSLLISLTSVHARTIYPTQRCHVYDDTSFIGIPGQCGTVLPYYPRRLILRSSRQLSHWYCSRRF
jgi:hypothetical protein